MNKLITKKSSILLVIFLLMNTIFSCQFLEEEVVVSYSSESFIIEPDNILEDLYQGEIRIFTPQDDFPIATVRDYVQWMPSDFSLVAQSLHEKVWDEPLDNWHLTLIDFDWKCEYIDNGPQEANFRYYKSEQVREKRSRFVSELSIYPRRNSVMGIKEEHYPELLHWKTIDLGNIDVTIRDVLEAAEKNGGSNIREEVGNACEIYMIQNPASAEYKGWKVVYQNTNGILGSYYIDPVTRKLTRKQEPNGRE